MKKKIGIQMMGIATLAILSTVILVMFAFYELFKKQVLDDLSINAHLLQAENALTEESLQRYSSDYDDLRITLIGADGKVIYDSLVSSDELDNHGNRPEFAQALQNGEASVIRESDTIQKSSFYYAVRLEDGNVLRLSREADSVVSILISVTPIILGIVVCLWILCAFLSRFLTDSLMKPIEQMANQLDHLENVESYEELIPFIQLIKKQHEDIMKSVTMRQDFTANVSHELKTPLTAISGYSELIENGMATEADVQRFAGEIHHSANRLLTLINDTIRLSELDSSEMTDTVEEVNLYSIAETCVNMLKISAGNHNVSISVSGKPVSVMADKQMMEELVYNLCDNAIRYNNPGGYVLVTVGGINGEKYLKVKDTGIGIAKEHQERIFERFYRVDKSRSKSTGGTGLGLAIVKHIVAKCGARVQLSSEPEKGTEITVFFPENLKKDHKNHGKGVDNGEKVVYDTNCNK